MGGSTLLERRHSGTGVQQLAEEHRVDELSFLLVAELGPEARSCAALWMSLPRQVAAAAIAPKAASTGAMSVTTPPTATPVVSGTSRSTSSSWLRIMRRRTFPSSMSSLVLSTSSLAAISICSIQVCSSFSPSLTLLLDSPLIGLLPYYWFHFSATSTLVIAPTFSWHSRSHPPPASRPLRGPCTILIVAWPYTLPRG